MDFVPGTVCNSRSCVLLPQRFQIGSFYPVRKQTRICHVVESRWAMSISEVSGLENALLTLPGIQNLAQSDVVLLTNRCVEGAADSGHARNH